MAVTQVPWDAEVMCRAIFCLYLGALGFGNRNITPPPRGEMEAMYSRDEMEAQASESHPKTRYIFDCVGEVRMYVHQQKV